MYNNFMINLLAASPITFLIVLAGIIISLVIHEYAHCFITDFLGDPTPRSQDRVTLDPRAHIDPLGLAAIIFTGFGWGKPAPYDPYNLKDPIKEGAIIAAAGPLTNLALATLSALIARTGIIPFGLINGALYILASLNISLAIFNLIPVHPLDGSKILAAFLPLQTRLEYISFMQRYGTMILFALIIPWGNGSSPISYITLPITNIISTFLLG